MTTATLIPVVVQIVILAVAGFVGYWVFVVKATNRISVIETRCAAHIEILGKVDAMRTTVNRMEADNLVFWRVIEPHLGGIIHSPSAKDRDVLVDKFIRGKETMTNEEYSELVRLLRLALENPEWPAEKRWAGAMLLARLLQLEGQRRDDPC